MVATQRHQVRRPDEVDAAREHVGRHRQADQRRVAAVAAARDRDLVLRRDAAVDRPRHRVEQVVVHLAAPLVVGGVEELLAEAGRAAEVDLEHRVAAVREQLVDRRVAVVVARPRPAVREQHERHRPGRADRLGQVAHERHPVARRDHHGLLRRERLLVERGPRREQVRPGVLGVVPLVDLPGVLRRADRDDPGLEVVRRRQHREVAVAGELGQAVEVGLHRLVEGAPVIALVVERDRERLEGRRVLHEVAGVGLRVVGEDRLLLRRDVALDERAGVAPAAVFHVQRLVIRPDADDVGRLRVLERHGVVELPALRLGIALVDLLLARLVQLRREDRREIVVEHEAGHLVVVLDHERALAGRDVEVVEVHVLRVAIVDRDRDRAGLAHRQPGHLDARALVRREVGGLAAAVGAEQVEVLVAGVVLLVDDLVVHRPEVLADRARGVARDRGGLVELADRRDEHVQHTVRRGDPRELLAVGADLHVRALGVSEQHAARDQILLGMAGRGRRRGRRGRWLRLHRRRRSRRRLGQRGRGCGRRRRAAAGRREAGEGGEGGEPREALHPRGVPRRRGAPWHTLAPWRTGS